MSIKTFFASTRTELSHVTWPQARQVIISTIAIIVVSVFIGYFLGFFDMIFSRGLEKLLTK